jgi:hypothetical protein
LISVSLKTNEGIIDPEIISEKYGRKTKNDAWPLYQGCQIISGNKPKREKMYQNCFEYTKWPQSIPKLQFKFQMDKKQVPQNFHTKVFQKYTQICKFGMKINHLATLAEICGRQKRGETRGCRKGVDPKRAAECGGRKCINNSKK